MQDIKLSPLEAKVLSAYKAGITDARAIASSLTDAIKINQPRINQIQFILDGLSDAGLLPVVAKDIFAESKIVFKENGASLEVLADGIKIDRQPKLVHMGITGWATVWSADGDYDAWYPLFDQSGVEKEIAFIRKHNAEKKEAN